MASGKKSSIGGLPLSINRSATSPTTRRQFIRGSSAVLAGVAGAGIISQSACSGGAAQAAAVSQSPPSAAPPPTAVAQPTVTNYLPRCLLDASDLVTGGLVNGASVLHWADRTDSAYDLLFLPAIPDIAGVWKHSPPTLIAAAVNNLPAVSFAASQSQTMIWTPGGSLDQGLDGFSAIFVIRPDTSLIYDAAYLFITHTADQATRVGIVFNPTQGGVRAIIETAGVEYNLPTPGSASQGIPFGALNAPVWGILSLRVWYGLNPNATLQVNASQFEHHLSQRGDPHHPELHGRFVQHLGDQSSDMSNCGDVLLPGISLGRSALSNQERSADEIRASGVSFTARVLSAACAVAAARQ